MPNWVQNEIIFENIGDEKVAALVRELKLSTENGERAFDFNKLIPMPESLNIESGSNTDRAIAYYVTERLTIPVEQTNLSGLISNCFSNDWANEVVSRLKNETETSPEVWDKLYENGKQYMYNREHYGCYTWFDWCRRNWGTKWNACNAEWSLDDGMLVFQTAWSAPFPIIEALAEKYPDLDFTHRWADEDIGNNCGRKTYENGECTDTYYPEERIESVEFACKVHGYDSMQDLGLSKNASGDGIIDIWSNEYEAVFVCEQPALFANEKLTDADIPEGLFCYYLRNRDDGEGFATLEPKVSVNFGGTVITSEPIEIPEQVYII